VRFLLADHLAACNLEMELVAAQPQAMQPQLSRSTRCGPDLIDVLGSG